MFVLLILAALVVLAIAEIVLTETENFGWATLTLIATLVGVQVFHNTLGFNLLGWIESHALETVLLSIGYVVVGVIWSFVKWFSFLLSYRDKFRELRTSFLKSQNEKRFQLEQTTGRLQEALDVSGPVPDELRDAFAEWLRANARWDAQGRNIATLERPRASKNKSRIVAWMSFWPFSLIGTLLNDPVRRLFNFLFAWFKALYQQMADRIFAKDLELK